MSFIESLFNVTTLPPDIPEVDLYSYLLPKCCEMSAEPQVNEHDIQTSSQHFLDMWSICPMPPTPPHLTSAITVIGDWFRILVALYEADTNTLTDSRVIQFQTLLNDVIHYGRSSAPTEEALTNVMSSPSLSPSLSPSKRTQLRAYLTQYPLYATLLLVDSLGELELKQWWLWLLARLREANGAVSYEVCLQFDRLREKYQNQLLPCSALYLQNCTLSELRLRLAENKDFDVLSPYLKPTIKKKKSSRLPYQSDNEHKRLLLLDNDEEVEVVTPTDIDGDEQSQYVERKGLLRQPELTHQQQKRQFQLKKAGMSRAIHRANLQLPMGKDALTPAQLLAWIQFHCPQLPEGDIVSIEPAERSYWCLLFLSLIGLANFELLVMNRNAKEQERIKTNSLVYELDRDSHCTSMVILPTDIFKGKQPEHAGVQYYSVENYLEIVLPWPIQSLLNYILRLLPANKRHKKSLDEVLGVTQREYQTWLKSKIGDSKQRFAFKITPAKITRAFFRFGAQRLPDITSDYLKSQGSVQAHYINLEVTEISAILHQSWREFLRAMNFSSSLGWDGETSLTASLVKSHHNQIGSAITLRVELLAKALERHFEPFKHKALPTTAKQRLEWIERIVLYLHIRTAIELALRPVNDPYPEDLHCDWTRGCWTVADKRSHHKDERRLLVLSESLVAILTRYKTWAQKMSSSYYKEGHTVLTVFDGQHWHPLTRSNVQHLLNKYLDRTDIGSFRHLACRNSLQEVLLSHNQFDQIELNVLMNHFQRGQNPLGAYSLLSVSHLIGQQRNMFQRQQEGKSSYECSKLWSTFQECDERILSVLGYWERRGRRID